MPSSSGRSSPDPEGQGNSSSLVWERDKEGGGSCNSSSSRGGGGDRESGQRTRAQEEDGHYYDSNANASPRGGTADHGTSEGRGNGEAGRDNGGDGDDRLLPSATVIPQRFACSRCAKCKHQSKGTYYCRVILLHLFAPSWEDADQGRPWEIPRGFLKWLRREGPLEGCEVRQHSD